MGINRPGRSSASAKSAAAGLIQIERGRTLREPIVIRSYAVGHPDFASLTITRSASIAPELAIREGSKRRTSLESMLIDSH